MTNLIAENERTALTQAQQTLDELNERIQAIAERQAAIPGLIEEQNERLGQAIIGRLAAGAIHSQIEKLEREARQLDSEAAALAKPYAHAEKALAQAQAEAARDRYAALAAEAVIYPRRVWGHIDGAYQALRRLHELQNEMRECDQQAGRLAPITIRPESDIFIPLFVGLAIATAFNDIRSANVKLFLEAVE